MLPVRWQTPISIRTYELDFYGVVNNAVYLNYFEEARLDFLRQLGIDFFKMVAEGIVPVVARAVVEYKIPIRGGDRIVVKGEVARLGGSSMEMRYLLTSQISGKDMAHGETVLVFINKRGRPTRIPEAFRAALAAFSSKSTSPDPSK
jgi:acyl-CoA thioester hydrolase